LALREITRRAGVPFIFKASYDKANRTSGASFRGPGLAEGVRVLGRVRQTALIEAAARTGRAVNVKKGQFLAPLDMRHAIAKVTATGNKKVIVTERGYSFGYNNLVVDMRAFPILRSLGYPVVYDVTHSLQLPGGGDGVTAGQAEFIEPMARAGVAAGVDGVFMEVHQDPPKAKSDAQNALKLDLLPALLDQLVHIHHIASTAAVTR